MKRIAIFLVMLAASGCATDEAAETARSSTSSTESSASTFVSSTLPGSTVAEGSKPTGGSEDLEAFLAALEDLLAGTAYEGEPLNEPDVFVATGRLFCDLLDEGDSVDNVLTAYLDELAGGPDAATEDDLVLAGAMLGAAVGALCPEHADQVD